MTTSPDKDFGLQWHKARLNDEVYSKCVNIRHTVFQAEQNVPIEIEIDNEDVAHHFLVTDKDGEGVATARFRYTSEGYKCERCAVMKNHRGLGVGLFLIKNLVKEIIAFREDSQEPIFTHGQTHALGFWKKLGFVEHGDIFVEAGIEHYHMIFDETGY